MGSDTPDPVVLKSLEKGFAGKTRAGQIREIQSRLAGYELGPLTDDLASVYLKLLEHTS